MTSALLSAQTPVLPGQPGEGAHHAFGGLAEEIQEAVAPVREFLLSVFEAAPYIARLAQRRPATLAACLTQDPETLVEHAIANARTAGSAAPDVAALDAALRQAKADIHLVVALADLAGVWQVDAVTAAMTRFADGAVAAALHGHARLLADQGRAVPVGDPENPLPGLFVLALGKMGTGDLNYSSDIDLVLFYDPDALLLPESEEPRKRLPRLVQAVTRSLQDVTSEGYVFRVDLRLRPDPGATPVVISTDAALNYYESLGQTWERAAWIKARPCAGDFAAAERFLDLLQPFIWRRSLDFAAVDDIRGLARQIQTVGRRAEIRPAGHDLKLGRGGIREIEFYAQIPQLVFGGRDKSLRVKATLDVLRALVAADIVPAEAAEALAADYRLLRAWEHRIQMRQDEASQTLPERDGDRLAIAHMAGHDGLESFERAVEACLRRVHGHFSDQFEADEALASEAGSLILTGVEPTPDTLETLSRLGFADPQASWKRLNAWSAGRVRAVRSSRARTLFARIAPQLVDRMASTGEPDAALTRFGAFFENLPMGVQPLALLSNEPGLAGDLIGVLTLAPRMATDLARRPNLLDAMLDHRFSVPVRDDPPGEFRTRMMAAVERCDTYEDSLNEARRIVREEKLRIGTQVLRGTVDAEASGLAYSAVADASVAAMALAARRETERRFGAMPGRSLVLGMGKLGGRELASDSDLDIMIIHEGEADAQSWFGRYAQRLVSALSAPTEEGELYEVDMQLRPSGKAGPVAVSIARFEAYYPNEAWTWEMMALTRARIITGEAALADRVHAAIRDALQRTREARGVRQDALDMLKRLEAAKPAQSDWDLKARAGGIQDIEFVAQTLQLVHAAGKDVVRPSTAEALRALAAAGALPEDEAGILADSLHLYLGLLQLIRTAHGSGFDPAGASAGFAALLAGYAGADSLEALADALAGRTTRVRNIFERRVGKMH